MGAVGIRGGAVATSGDYERFVVVGGERYHHILDPRDGRPASGCVSATVVMPPGPHAGEQADAWATVLCVLGFQEGLTHLRRAVPGAEAVLFDRAGRVHKSAGFPVSLPPIEELRTR